MEARNRLLGGNVEPQKKLVAEAEAGNSWSVLVVR